MSASEKPAGIGHALFLGALFAQVDLLHLAADDLGQMHRGVFSLANFANHRLLRSRRFGALPAI